jgi:hypothetical protein
VAWLLAALRHHGPYPVLALFGEGGTAKSTLLSFAGALIDPSIQSLLTPPRDDRDLFINAVNRYALIFDNISTLLDWISDTLSRLATGAGYSTRALYTDDEEVLLDAIRPIALAGIEDFIRRPDLADRAIFLTLEPIPEDKRRPESELWAAFNADRPRILGALLDAVAMGLARLPEIQLQRLPRMADFAIWATACETALRRQDGTFWEEGAFMKAYVSNIDTTILTVLEANPIATAVRNFMQLQTTWSGTATDLLDLLGRVAGEKATKAKTWPTDAIRLAGRLRRAATFLRKVGIEITTARQAQERIITITSAQPEQESHSAPAARADANGRGAGAGSRGDGELPYLQDRHIHKVAEAYSTAAAMELEKTGDVNRTALDRWLRESLAALGVPAQSVEIDFNRVMAVLTTLH